MSNQIIKGRDLMLFNASGNSFAYATSHSLNINAETGDISSKVENAITKVMKDKMSSFSSDNAFVKTFCFSSSKYVWILKPDKAICFAGRFKIFDASSKLAWE